jgi:3-oxoacyl-[acyl-carrier protein] reductase
MTRQFLNRVALVTGGSRGIGAAIVRRLASDGASVAFTYSSSEKQALELVSEVEDARGIAFAIKADSAVPEAVRGAVARAVARFGRLDVLVNNAGILLQGTTTSTGWWRSTSRRYLWRRRLQFPIFGRAPGLSRRAA